MDVFELRNRLVDDYGSYVGSFIRIKDARIEAGSGSSCVV